MLALLELMHAQIAPRSNQLNIPYRICYSMIRGVMERIASAEAIKLDGTVETMNCIQRLV